MLYKVEMMADFAFKSSFFGFYVRPSGKEERTFMPPSWGSLEGVGSLAKASGLTWSPQQVAGAEVCVWLRNGTSLADFCGPTGGCAMFLFDRSRRCCPLYVVPTSP